MEEASPDRRAGSIQVLQRATDVLDVVARAHSPLSGAELARQVGLNKSTAFNILATLVDLGFLSYAPEGRRYRLGPRAFQLSNAFQASFQLSAIAESWLYTLRDDTGETASLHVRSGWDRVCIVQAPSLQSITRVIELGRRRPLYTGAAGMVLLSGLDDVRVKDYLAKTKLVQATRNTVTEPERVQAKVAQARELGFAEAYEESENGVNALAVPVRDQTGSIDTALVISGPTTRYDKPAMERTLAAAQSAAAEISRERGNIVGG